MFQPPHLQYLILIISGMLMTMIPSAKAQSDTTTLIFVGTIHYPTKNFNNQLLFEVLQKIKPDVILVKLDSSFFDSSMSIK